MNSGSGTAYQCSDCGKVMAQDMSHRCVSTGGANPAEMKPGTCTLSDIEPGGAFMTADGTMALKSEYQLRPDDPASPAMCIIFGSGEYFHGEAPGVHGNDVQVWPIYIPIASNSWRDKHVNPLRLTPDRWGAISMQTENGLIVGCYTLDLYCVVDNTFGQFTGRTESECIRAARRDGWRVSSTRVLCPQHATKQSFTADRLGAPPQTEAKGK